MVQVYQDKLTPAEINRLHGYYNMTYSEEAKSYNTYDDMIAKGYKLAEIENDCAERTKRYSGTYGVNNANESVFYDACSQTEDKKKFIDFGTGKTYLPTSSTDQDYTIAFARNASSIVNALVSFDNAGKVKVDFKTDPSCVIHSKSLNYVLVRGVCTLTFADNFDVSELNATINCGAFPFTPVPGQTYTFDAEFIASYSCDRLWTARIINLETRKVVQSN